MKMTRENLYRIILEEYLAEEGITVEGRDEDVEDLLRRIQGDKYRPPEERDPARYANNDGETWPMEKPHDPGPSIRAKARQSAIDQRAKDIASRVAPAPAAPDVLADTIGELVQGMDPEEVAEIFQAVFEKIPGVELSSPGDEDYPEDPETLYSPGAEGRPVVGFEELKVMIGKMLVEGHYHDMGGEDELYNVLDPEEERSEEAIAAAAAQRGDGQTFEEWLELLISTLMHTTNLGIEHAEELPQEENYYDKWLAGEDASTVAAEIAHNV
jgi:hypothetical protein